MAGVTGVAGVVSTPEAGPCDDAEEIMEVVTGAADEVLSERGVSVLSLGAGVGCVGAVCWIDDAVGSEAGGAGGGEGVSGGTLGVRDGVAGIPRAAETPGYGVGVRLAREGERRTGGGGGGGGGLAMGGRIVGAVPGVAAAAGVVAATTEDVATVAAVAVACAGEAIAATGRGEGANAGAGVDGGAGADAGTSPPGRRAVKASALVRRTRRPGMRVTETARPAVARRAGGGGARPKGWARCSEGGGGGKAAPVMGFPVAEAALPGAVEALGVTAHGAGRRPGGRRPSRHSAAASSGLNACRVAAPRKVV